MDVNFWSSVAAKVGRAGKHKPQCRRSRSGLSRNNDGHIVHTVLLGLHCVYPVGAIRVGQRGSCLGCDVSDSVVVLLWCLPSSQSPDSALGVFFHSCRVGWFDGLGARVGMEKGRNCGQTGGWRSCFLSRISVDELAKSHCERLLISIKPD